MTNSRKLEDFFQHVEDLIGSRNATDEERERFGRKKKDTGDKGTGAREGVKSTAKSSRAAILPIDN